MSASDLLAISIGSQTSDVGSYSTPAGNYGIAGAGVSGFSSFQTCTVSVSLGTSVSLQFTTTGESVVLILIGGQGTGNIALSGFRCRLWQTKLTARAEEFWLRRQFTPGSLGLVRIP